MFTPDTAREGDRPAGARLWDSSTSGEAVIATSQQRSALAYAALLLALIAAVLATAGLAKADTADAATAKYSIAVFLSQPADRCYDPGVVDAIRHFVQKRVADLNRMPEFSDRQLRADFYNDYSDPETAVANVRKALENPNTLAMIGLSGSNRGKAVFEKLGEDINRRNIPFITDLSATSLFEAFPNTFTMRPSQENERVPVIMQFLKDSKFQKPAFVGIANNAASEELSKLLSETSDGPALVSTQSIPIKDGKAEDIQVKAAIANLAQSDADIVFALLGSSVIDQFLTEAKAAGLRSEIFLLTENERSLRTEEARSYPSNLYQFAWQSLPEVYSGRMRREILAQPTLRWLFADAPNKSAKGWSDNTCKPPADGIAANVLDTLNLRALTRGTRFGDMVGLIGEIIKTSPPDIGLEGLRGRVLQSLRTTFAAGRGTYSGKFSNWSFNPQQRTVSQTPLILKKSRNLQNPRLASRQYVKLRNGNLSTVTTVYMDLDLTRLYRIDDNEKSFYAEFFLTLDEDSGVPVSGIEFANAFSDADSGGQKITIQPLNEGPDRGIYPGGIRLYKVTGKFMMRPDFSRYPFDTQLFSIELKPKNSDTAFIVQPPPAELRDRVFETDGWALRDQYVGYDEDYIPVTDARTDEKSIIPYYKAEYAYVMRREATDYYLRVVVPLGFILIVAYLSIFIPREHFEAVVTIQVTALLSAVALYLSIPKVGNDAATISDRIFLIDYLAVSAMIAISIARVNPWLRGRDGVDVVLKWVHIFGLPVLIAGMTYYLANLGWQDPQAFFGDQDTAQVVSAPNDKPAKQ